MSQAWSASSRPSALALEAPAIIRPISSRGMSGGDDADDPAVVHHRDPVGQRGDLVQLGGDDQHRGAAGRAPSTIRLWMNSIEPTSTPRVGCEATSTFSGRDSSRATTTFCWLPPDSDEHRRARWTGCGCRTPRPAPSAFSSIASGRSARPVENGVVAVAGRGPGSRRRVNDADEAVVGAVLGDVADARRRATRAGPCREMSLPSSEIRRRRAGSAPSSALMSSVWPLPWTPAMPRTSPARTSNETSLTTVCPRSSIDGEALDLEHRRRRPAAASLSTTQLDRAADHHLGELGLGRARRRGADHLAAADHGDPVPDRLDLA